MQLDSIAIARKRVAAGKDREIGKRKKERKNQQVILIKMCYIGKKG